MFFLYPHQLFAALYENYADAFMELAGGGREVVANFWRSVRGGGALGDRVRNAIRPIEA